MLTAKQVQQALQKVSSAKKAAASAWFFKTGKGEYGYGDKFRGVTVPEERQIAKHFKDLPLTEIIKLLQSPWHEDRLTAIFLLVYQFQQGDKLTQKKIYETYLGNTKYINNWDIVDSSAAQIVGGYLKDNPLPVLTKLAKSKLMWERRIAMIATLYTIKQNQPDPALQIAKILLKDKEDLIHKAVGWMLREVGKNCSSAIECDFLDRYAKIMPRTMLRYAIERLPEKQRLNYLHS
ncbi:MAG: DNA alkylation repair protein [Patescibacteria group bacterium]